MTVDCTATGGTVAAGWLAAAPVVGAYENRRPSAGAWATAVGAATGAAIVDWTTTGRDA